MPIRPEEMSFPRVAEFLDDYASHLRDQSDRDSASARQSAEIQAQEIEAAAALVRLDTCLMKLHPQEPWFTFRGQDEEAYRAVDGWFRRCLNRGVLFQMPKLNHLMTTLKAMKEWQPKKLPD